MQTYEQILAVMQDRYRELTGFDADYASDIGIRLQVLAQQLHKLYGSLEETRLQVFPQTSTGICLDRHAEARGLARKNAQPSVGVLRFSRETVSAADIPIPAGTVCATRPTPQVQFATTRNMLLAAGKSYVDVPAQAVDLGEQGNVAAAAVCLMVSAVPGITAVCNPQLFSGGVDTESDEALRARLLESYRNISNGANPAYYYDMAMQYEAVSAVNVISRARGRGTVDVVINCNALASEEDTLLSLQKRLDSAREINVDVKVSLASKKTVPMALSVHPLDGYDFTLIQAGCVQALRNYLARLPVGGPLLLAGVSRAVMEVEGVYNCKITSPAADVYPDPDQVAASSTITVSRLGAV